MKPKVKIAIFLVALVITLLGFNLVASPSVLQIFGLKEVRGPDIVVTVTAYAGASGNTIVQFSG